jgi:integrative and conjugative element protein (TIGR02256 family)
MGSVPTRALAGVSMHAGLVCIWIKRHLLQKMLTEASLRYPMETGGVFLGYWAEERQNVVVTKVIGPGPQANHRECSFVPDYDYQEQQIAKYYEKSGRLRYYLGDWHTHPDTTNTFLSQKDCRTLGRIAVSHKARCPTPVMGVIAGTPDNWTTAIWKGEGRWLSGWLGARTRLISVKLW